MMRRSLITSTLFLFLSGGQVASTEAPFKMIAESTAYCQNMTSKKLTNSTVIGGDEVSVNKWSATLRLDGNEDCTATLVGPRAVLTAAHCVADSSQGTLEVCGNKIDATCDHHPDYQEDVDEADEDWYAKVSPDFALCQLDESVEFITYETIETDSKKVAIGVNLGLLGFGCGRENHGMVTDFGDLRLGEARIMEIPKPPSYFAVTDSGATLCDGDSGGAAYFLDCDQERKIAGVNAGQSCYRFSSIAITSTDGFLSWARSWSQLANLQICGIHSGIGSCRNDPFNNSLGSNRLRSVLRPIL